MNEGNYSKLLFSTRSKEKWQSIGAHRRAGVLLPLFSVYSKKSLGIGEFEDLKPAVDWCIKAGFSIIQLLPINEVGPVFCPYDSVSSFALEPVYISLRLLPHTGKKAIKGKIDAFKKRFPCGGPHVDYKVKWEKLSILWDIYSEEKIDSLKDFKAFRRENEYWIEDFALFKILKENNGGTAWYDWPDPLKHRDPAALKSFTEAHAKEIVFHIWIQWRLYQQLKDARDYAADKGILLKGDLPILVSRDSADVWAHPEFFKLDLASGAPPDMYCAKGQRWGMPTYNWEAIEKLGFRYLKEKLKYAENFYDLLRIDHVVGLFRIWSIPYSEPMENQGLHGFFDPPDESKWGNHGKKILSVMLENTSMLLCAEDLGVIPKVCTDTLAEFGIPGNNVQRWVKDWDNKHDFLSPEEYRFLSVAMLSTHDTTNWAAWWEYEAGTVDEQLFIRKCADRGIDYSRVRAMLFHPELSRYGRLRWLDGIGSIDVLVKILGRRHDETGDFIDLYKNSFREKEKLWNQLCLKGYMREKADADIIGSALEISQGSQSIFCIELITDLFYLTDIFTGDAYQYRMNTPGTISGRNWSLVIPAALEDPIWNDLAGVLREILIAANRVTIP